MKRRYGDAFGYSGSYSSKKRKPNTTEQIIIPGTSTQSVVRYNNRYVVPSDSIAFTNRIASTSRYSSKYNTEVKSKDTNLHIVTVPTDTNTNTYVSPVNLIQMGSGAYNRVGRKIKMKSLAFTIVVTTAISPSTVSEYPSQYGRCAFVYDRSPNGVLPKWSDIFGTTVEDGTESSSMIAPMNPENTERFVLLKDIYYTAHPNVSSTNAGVQVVREVFKGYLPLKALETVYNGNDAPMTISDINVGGLYMVPRCAFSMFGNGGTCQTTLDGSFRLRYFDN